MKECSEKIILKDNILDDEENFIKKILFSSTQIISDKEFEKYGLKNKNIMFFMNYITESISSVSMLGSRNLGMSLLGKIENIIEYYSNMVQLFEFKEKNPKLPKAKIDYIRTCIKNNIIIEKKEKDKYMRFLKNGNDENDKEFIENLKLIYSSLINNKYFETVSDKLYDILSEKKQNDDDFDQIALIGDEYLSLLMDYVGISIFEIKRIIRDSYRQFFKTHNQDVFLNLFTKFAETYNKNNEYLLFIKMDKKFDEKLVTSLKHSGNDNYLIYSKSGFQKKIKEEKVNNQKNLKSIIETYVENSNDNNYFLYTQLKSKDIWHAIKMFRQKTIQPFIGSMLYSGIRVNTQSKYIVIEYKENKKFINEYQYYDDIFKPLSQDRINYSDVFKRYIIKNNNNDIRKIIDEAVQLLPYYKTSDSILTKFTNTWFALETLFRNSSDMIVKSLDDYASKLVADRMIAGYIYVTAIQISKIYYNFNKYTNNFIENIFINYNKIKEKECSYIEWKYNRIIYIVNNYEDYFDSRLKESRQLLDNAYRLRNKQFHGSKDSQLENMAGFLYDIVNDTIAFYIDYLDVYKNEKTDFLSLYNSIKNIKLIKSSILNNKEENIDKIIVLYDSIRKI